MSFSSLTVAAIQMVSQPTMSFNLDVVDALVKEAKQKGAELVVLPENFACFPCEDYLSFARTESLNVMQHLSQLAQLHQVWIIAGTVPMAIPATTECATMGERVRSACFVFNAEGVCVGRYDKIHLFDVSVEDAVGSYQESKQFEAGVAPCVVDTPWGKIGIAICYDLRFPELFRWFSLHQAVMAVVPSAFTRVTGQAHWEVLLRARAIENQLYIVAANQGGIHYGVSQSSDKNASTTPLLPRETHGHSMIIDAWGNIVRQCEYGAQVVVATIDLTEQTTLRKNFPVLSHRRL
jgi:deaminated glutathione amidase